jgi:hypothetical protein
VKKLLVLLVVLGAVAAFLYYPRGTSVASASDAATLAILNTTIEGSRSGGSFAPALDGEVYRSGDLVRANVDGRAVLTFFDASTLTVDSGSQVKVIALNKLPAEGIQVTIQQDLGRSWSSVQKLKTPDSKWEMRTPSTTAVVRGTGFLTLVQANPGGGTTTTYQVDEGTLLVTATAGGTVSVPAGTQVSIADGQPAPAAPTPIAPSPHFDITASGGLSFLAIAPSGASCGPFGGKAEIFGCIATSNKTTARDPAAGRWGLFLTSPTTQTGTLTVDAWFGATRQATRTLSRAFNAGDEIRTGITLTAGPPQALSAFEDPVVVTSLCAAIAPGRAFAAGALDARIEAARSFAVTNKAAAIALVYTEAEINQAATANPPTGQGFTVSDSKVTIDQAGIHAAAKATTQILTLNANADVIGGTVHDKFMLRVSRLAADPLPPGLVDALKAIAEGGSATFADQVPFLVRQVSFRSGCFFVAGMTPS